MRITKEELLQKAKASHAHPHPKFYGDALGDWEDGVVAGAQVAGYEVVEELALPKRLMSVRGKEGSVLLCEDVDDQRFRPIVEMRPRSTSVAAWNEFEWFKAELVLRYNAKAEVLAIADELEHSRIEPDVHAKPVADRLRAAYGELDTTAGVVSAVAQGLGAPTMKSGGQRVPGR